MTPIHHHFEMKAWSETKIMVRFWIVTRDPLRARLRPLLPLLLPVLPALSGPGDMVVRDRRGAEVIAALAEDVAPDGDVVVVDRSVDRLEA